MKKTIEKFEPTEDMIKAAELVFVLRAAVGTIRPVVEGYQRAILARHQFTNKGEMKLLTEKPELIGTRAEPVLTVITDPQHTYLMDEDDFAIYHRECNEARIKAGFFVESEDNCPLLVVQHQLIDAERNLVDLMEPVTKIGFDQVMQAAHGLDNLARLIEINLSFLIKFIEQGRIKKLLDETYALFMAQEVATDA